MNTQHNIENTRDQDFFTLEEVKNFLRVSNKNDDEHIERIIDASIEIAENYTGLSIKRRLICCLIKNPGKSYLNFYIKHFPVIEMLDIRAETIRGIITENITLERLEYISYAESFAIKNTARYKSLTIRYEAWIYSRIHTCCAKAGYFSSYLLYV